MKLRCTENSIRLRLRKSELEQFSKEGKVKESVHFLNKAILTFVLLKNDALTNIQAQFEDGFLKIHLPAALSEQWINSNQVSIETHTVLENGKPQHILVEKDFPCKDRVGEDKADFFGELEEKSC